MSRYSCPPWYECRCVRGKIVCFRTMWNHRKQANERRAALGRGSFKIGPRVPPDATEYYFSSNESLVKHETDDERDLTKFGIGSSSNRQLQENEEAVSNDDENEDVEMHPIPSEDSDSTNSLIQHAKPWINVLSRPSNELSTNQSNPNDLRCHLPSTSALQITIGQDRTSNILPDIGDGSVENGAGQDNITNHPQGSRSSTQHTSYCNTATLPLNIASNAVEVPFHLSLQINSSNPAGGEQVSSNDEPHPILSDLNISLLNNQQTNEPSSEDLHHNHGCRIPGMWEWVVENRELVDIYFKHGLEYTVMDDMLKYLNAPCKTWVAVVDAIHRYSGLREKLIHTPTCPGHMAFVNWTTYSRYEEKCLYCERPRPDRIAEAKEYFTYIPLIPRIRAMVSDENSCKELYDYRHEEQESTDNLTDVFDGMAYKDICNEYGGEEQIKWDVFIGASMDGFQVFKKIDYEVWSVAALNLNLSPDKRYLPRNILALSFLPGPNQPKNIQSFLVPFIKEVQQSTENGGITMQFYDSVVRRVRIHLLYFSGDQPAVSKAAGLAGHNGRHPCRNCNIPGQYVGHYYYPSRLKNSISDEYEINQFFSPRDLPLRTVVESRARVVEIEDLTGSRKTEAQKKYGIMERSLLCYLPTMHEYKSFVHDVMHTFMNITKEVLRVMIHSGIEDSFSFSENRVQLFDKEIISWRENICGQVSDPPPPLSKYTRWKAAECKTFALSYMLVLFHGFLDDMYLNGLSQFAMIVDIASRPILTRKDISQLRINCVDFFEHYEREYFKYDRSRINLCKSIFHVLLHLADCAEYMGPLSGVSQFWIERYIGWIGDRLNSRQRPAESMTKSCVYYESYKMAFNKAVHENSSDYERVQEAGGFLFQTPSKLSALNGESRVGRNRVRVLRLYLRRKYLGIQNCELNQIVQGISKVKLHSRIQFVVGSDVVCAGGYYRIGTDQPRKTDGRADFYVAVEMDHSSTGCDVYYGRIMELLEFEVPAGIFNGVEQHGTHHQVAIMDWARQMRVGQQGQVYKYGTPSEVFTNITMEDVVCINRLISVVEHTMPSSSRSEGSRRSYFIDENARIDHLLTDEKSYDGYNRKLSDIIR